MFANICEQGVELRAQEAERKLENTPALSLNPGPKKK